MPAVSVSSRQEQSRESLYPVVGTEMQAQFPALIGQRQQGELFLSDLTGRLAGTHDLS